MKQNRTQLPVGCTSRHAAFSQNSEGCHWRVKLPCNSQQTQSVVSFISSSSGWG